MADGDERRQLRAAAAAALDGKAKPPGSLGLLEEWAIRLCELQGTLSPRVTSACLLLFAADHGVTLAEPRVSAYPRQVTPAMFAAIARGQAASSALCAANGVTLEVVDVGVDADVTAAPTTAGDGSGGKATPCEGAPAAAAAAGGRPQPALVHHAKVARGSASFLSGPAMTEEECAAAMAAGAAAVARACDRAATLVKNSSSCADGGTGSASGLVLAVGELGIGNTTAASALLSALTGAPPSATVGAGTGVNAAGRAAKISAVEAALKANADLIAQGGALGALRAVGGLELAAMAGAYTEAARRGVPVLVDGFISGAAALAAVRAEPTVARALFASHASAEAGAALLLEALGLRAPLTMDLRLGEGTGAVLAVPLLRSAAALMGMASLQEVMAAGQ